MSLHCSIILPGLIVGAIIRYTFTITPVTHMNVNPENSTLANLSTVPPDELWLWFPYKSNNEIKNKTYSYRFHGDVNGKSNEIDYKVCLSLDTFITYPLNESYNFENRFSE